MKDDNEVWAEEPDLPALKRAHNLLQVDPKSALPALEQLAERGSIISMIYIASAYRDGAGVTRDIVEAERWYRRASNMESVFASHELGRLLLKRGEYLEASNNFALCAEAGYSPSLYQLAKLHLSGMGATKDTKKARELFEKSASKGNVYARRELAMNLMRGTFGKREIVTGLYMYLSALPQIIKAASDDPYSDRLRA